MATPSHRFDRLGAPSYVTTRPQLTSSNVSSGNHSFTATGREVDLPGFSHEHLVAPDRTPGPTTSSLSHSRKMSPNNSKGGYSKLPSMNASLTKPNPRVSRPISSSGPLGQISASGTNLTRTGFDVAQRDSFPIGLDSLVIRPPLFTVDFLLRTSPANSPRQTPNTTPTDLDDPQDENDRRY
jgi:hypothetical protein